jgi:chromate reductase
MTDRPRLLALSGSLRSQSFTNAILHSLREAVAGEAEVEILTLGDLPFYNEDLDTETPPAAVAALREAIARADGLIVATPEYNYSLPGLVKNALDWASRPYGRATIGGKPVVTITSSPAFTGGARVQGQLTELLFAIGARPLQRPQTVIGSVHEKIEQGRLTEPATLAFAVGAVRDLIAAVSPRALAAA